MRRKAAPGRAGARRRTRRSWSSITSTASSPAISTSITRRRRSDLLELAAARGPMRRLIVIGRGVDLSVAGDSDDDSAGWLSGVPRYEVARLRGDALRQAITEPALKASHLLENGLAERLVESAGEALAAMLQIQLALASLWELRREGWLTNRGLDGLGHLGGVFKRHLQSSGRARRRGSRGSACAVQGALPARAEGGSGRELAALVAGTHSSRPSPRSVPSGCAICCWPTVCSTCGAPGTTMARLERSKSPWSAAMPASISTTRSCSPMATFSAWRGRLASALTHWLQGGEQPSALLLDSALGEASHWHDTARRPADGSGARLHRIVARRLAAPLAGARGRRRRAAVAALEPRAMAASAAPGGRSRQRRPPLRRRAADARPLSIVAPDRH